MAQKGEPPYKIEVNYPLRLSDMLDGEMSVSGELTPEGLALFKRIFGEAVTEIGDVIDPEYCMGSADRGDDELYRHCVRWYDGDACCRCDVEAMSIEEKSRDTGAPICCGAHPDIVGAVKHEPTLMEFDSRDSKDVELWQCPKCKRYMET